MWTCKICGVTFDSLMGRASHLKAKHSMTVKEYYVLYPVLCKCGCGTVIKYCYKFAHGHHRKGAKLPEESKERIRQAQLGHISPTKGIPRSEKDKAVMKLAYTPEVRKKISDIKKYQHKNSNSYDFLKTERNPSKRPEVAAKISKAQTGHIKSKDTRKKLSLAHKGRIGNIVSEETKRKHSERMKRDNPMWRKEVISNHPVLKSGFYFISSGEQKLSIIFKEMNLDFIHQMKIAKEKGYYISDFFFPSYNKIIEFDGHESHRLNPENDIKRDAYILERYGYQTLRLLAPELNNRNREQLLYKIKEFLNETKTVKNTQQKIIRRTIRRVRFNNSRQS